MQFILALLLLPSATMTGDVGLCARIGAQSQPPAVVSRHVRYQLCTVDGHPLTRIERVGLTVESLTPGAAPAILAQSLATDHAGRFEVTYGAGSPSLELHTFWLDGRVIAAFQVERAGDVLNVTRADLRKNLQDREGGGTYP